MRVSYRSLRTSIIRNAAVTNTPVLGEFELTGRCNLKCKMCYVVDQTATDLPTDTWKKLFKQATDAGLLYALLTGGELFLRKDFSELYNYLYDLGVRITLFSNGIHIKDEIIETLKKRPPEQITITVYGASDATYETVTSDPRGFTKLNISIEKLKNANINFILRTIPLKPIYDDLENIIAFVEKQNTQLYYTQYIGPTRDGAFSHKAMRLEPKDLIKFSKTLEEAFGFESRKTFSTSTKQATCAALKSAYFINYKGMMQPCAMAYKPTKSILEDTFINTFKSLSKTYQQIEKYDGCYSCDLKSDCIQCYARRLLEKEVNHCPPYLKQLAIYKRQVKS